MNLSALMQSMSLETKEGSNLSQTAILINDIHTEIVIGRFKTRLMVICTQYEKIGALYRVFVENTKEDGQSSPVYLVQKLLGGECEEAAAAARFLAEKLQIQEELDCFLALKNYDIATVRTIAEALAEIVKLIK